MPKKAIIIEDDVNILYSLQSKFSVAGFEVEIDDGRLGDKEIVERIKKIKPGFIILDLVLPRADGFKILALLKADESLGAVPKFVFTNLSDQDSREKGMDLGASCYAIKSEMNIDEFVNKVLAVLKNVKMVD